MTDAELLKAALKREATLTATIERTRAEMARIESQLREQIADAKKARGEAKEARKEAVRAKNRYP